MNSAPKDSDVIAGLEAHAIAAPHDLLPAVLASAGLADHYVTVAGPTGDLFVAWNKDGVSAVAPATDAATFEETFRARTDRAVTPASKLPAALERSISRSVGTGKLGALPVDLSAVTPFQQDVLRVTATIPPGEIRSYRWVAREIGRPRASRAVGSALNRNPVPVFIPCHRVGRSDGTIGDYAFGPAMKRDLLRHEGLDPEVLDDDAARGVRYVGSETTEIYCFPTCHNAKRITEAHRVEFRSARSASNAGYRTCKVCRPVAAA